MPGMTKAGYVPPVPAKEPKKPEKQKRKPMGQKRKKKRMNAATIASLMVFALAFVIGAGTLHVFSKVEQSAETFALGQLLGGHPIGGMSAEGGAELLDKLTAETVNTWKAEICCQERTYTLTASDVGLFVDRRATLEPLWQVGKTGNMLERYMQLLKAQAEHINVDPVFGYTMEPVDAFLAQIKRDTDRESVDATVSFTPGSSEPFRFTDEQVGYRLDTAALRKQIKQAIISLKPISISAEPETIEPAMHRDALENAISLRSRVTMTLSSDEASMENVRIAAGVLSGQRIEAGESFSFNEVVGRRTAEGGYLPAPEPAYGVGAVGAGGGVCQVSTALYRAALLGDMEVLERSAAVRPVAYCEMGQEAAVSDQGIDLVIQNPTGTPVFLITRVYEAEDASFVLDLQIIGAPLEAQYALVSSPLETETITEPVYMKDADGVYAEYTDERIPGSEAQPGYSVVVERITLGSEDETLLTEVVSEDEYEPIAPIIYVGVKERN